MPPIRDAAEKRRDATALRAIAERIPHSEYLVEAADVLDDEAQALWPHSLGQIEGEPGHYGSWSWQVDASLDGTDDGYHVTIRVSSQNESRSTSLVIAPARARSIAVALLEIANHPAVREYDPKPLCPEPGCTLLAGHAGDHEEIPF